MFGAFYFGESAMATGPADNFTPGFSGGAVSASAGMSGHGTAAAAVAGRETAAGGSAGGPERAQQ